MASSPSSSSSSSSSLSSSSATELNISVAKSDYSSTISCTCTECTTFLRPILPSNSHCPRNFSHYIFPTAPKSPHDQTSLWIDKLSLAAYDMQTSTPVPASQSPNMTNSPQRLSLVTSSITIAKTNIRSAFPKTPGTLRCSDIHCRTRLPIRSAWAATTRLAGGPLCEEHEEQFFGAREQEEEVKAASPESAFMLQNSASQQRYGAGNRAWGSNYGGRVCQSGMSSRTSSQASWSSLASWKDDDAEFGWGARALDSKLCW